MLNEHINLRHFRVRGEQQQQHSHSGSGFPANRMILKLSDFDCYTLVQPQGIIGFLSVIHSSRLSDGNFD